MEILILLILVIFVAIILVFYTKEEPKTETVIKESCNHKIKLTDEEKDVVRNTCQSQNILIKKHCLLCDQTIYAQVGGTKKS